ncbi:hypothetical protein AB1283_00620 [Bacillus sp. S13(2024)]|uniref:hypothetical protein n=1 Tax=Bacillus sp. S13(2024) TaxID=3162885 RepID=UPI003D2250C5
MDKQKTKKTKVCTMCGNEKNSTTSFYAHRSILYQLDNRFPVCRDCLGSLVDDNDKSGNSLKNVMRMIDRPFLLEIFKSSQQESEKDSKSVFGIYMKNIQSLNQYKSLTWADSDFNTKQNGFVQESSVESSIEMTDDELNELMHFFGKGFNKEDYLWLQNEYSDFLNRYECDSKGMELLIKEICLTQLDIKIRRANKEKVDQQLKTLQDLLGSSNLKPVQETGANAVEQESFGTLIKKYENERPIPEPDEKWKDVDKIGKYVRVFFLGHLSRMLGIKNDYEDEYWEEINKYTVEEPIDEEEVEEHGSI